MRAHKRRFKIGKVEKLKMYENAQNSEKRKKLLSAAWGTAKKDTDPPHVDVSSLCTRAATGTPVENQEYKITSHR